MARRHRAAILTRIRTFFAARDVLEVETPVLGARTVTDPHIESFRVEERYLQSSPESAMKRLLAAGSGPIYQICKAFRKGESGPRHNPELTLLEWYRPGFDHHQLMDEVEALLEEVLEVGAAERVGFGSLFERHVGIDPHRATLADLAEKGRELLGPVGEAQSLHIEDWLSLLMARVVEPELGMVSPVFVYDYPTPLAALARIRNQEPPVAERFEVYFRGVELANGYHEIVEPARLRARFEQERVRRRELGREPVELDERLLQALEHGLPECSGVALGVDRLIMLAVGAASIREVIDFPFESA